MSEDRCRLCLETGVATLPIFRKKHGVALAKLTDVLQIELRVGTGLPGRMCSACATQLDAAYSFKQRCIASQAELKGQTMRAVRKASAGTRARRQAKRYSLSDSESEGSDKVPAEGKEGEEGGECRSCEGEFAATQQLEGKAEKTNKCLLCKKRFPSHSELRLHLKIHAGGGPVQCSLCDKVFLNETFLSYHQESHVRPAADGFHRKPYKCDVCNKSFLKQAHLVEHVRSHTGDRPFKCTECDKSFTTKCNLTRHGRTHVPM